MAWLSRNNFTPTDKLHSDDLNNLANDDRTWGGNVNGGGYTLSNVQLVGLKELAAGQVLSVFGRIGDVVAQSGDYTAAQVGAVPTARQVIAGPGLSGGGPLTSDITLNALVTSVFGRTGAVTLTSADITSASGVLVTRNIFTGPGLTGGGNLSTDRTLSVVPDSSNQQVQMMLAGSLIGTRHAVNFINGTNVTVTVADNPGSNRVDVTVAAVGGTTGMIDPTQTLGDLIVRGTSAPPTRLAVGSNGQVLVADSTQPLGLKWASPAVSPVTSVFGRTGVVVATVGDYSAAQVSNAVDTTQSYSNPAWLASLAWAKIINAPVFMVDPTTTKGDLIVHGSTTTRLPVAADGMVLTTDSSQAAGVKWGALTIPSQSPWTTDIDAANHVLKNVKSIGTGGASVTPGANNPLSVFLTSADVGSAVSSTMYSDGISHLHIGCSKNYTPTGLANTGSPWLQAYLASGDPCPMILQPAGPAGTVEPAGVGIGQTKPVFALDVVGDINLTGQYRVGGTPLAATPGLQTPWIADIDGASKNLNNVNGIGIGGTAGGQRLHINTPFPTILMESAANADQAVLQMNLGSLYRWQVGVGLPSAGVFFIRDMNGGNRLTIDASGNMGVGHPASFSLDVAGDVNCTGLFRINGVPTGAVASVFGRTGAVNAATGDYSAAQVANAVDQTQTYSNPNWLTSLAWSKITGAPATGVSSVFGRSGAVTAGNNDYTVAQVTGAVPNSLNLTAGTGLTGGGNLSQNRSFAVVPDTTNQQVQVMSGGTLVATRRAINFISGANVSLSIVDSTPANNRVDITVSSTGGSGGMVDPTTSVGDLIVRGSSAVSRLGVGANGTVLTADSSQLLGVKWAVPTGGGGGGSQTPWTSDIDAAAFHLHNAGGIGVNSTANPTAARVYVVTSGLEDGLATINNTAADFASMSVANDVGDFLRVRSYGTAYITDPGMAALEASAALKLLANGAEIIRLTSGHVLIGTSTDDAANMVQVNGTVKSASGGFVFPDGTTQTTASTPATSPVQSVFSRVGAVVAQGGDYTAAQVTNAVDSTNAYANPAWITSLAWSKITGAPAAPVASVFGRTGAVVALAGDYTAAKVTNAVDQTGAYANPAWITSLPWSKITGAPASYTDPLTTKGDLVARSASATTRLGAGTDGQVLTADSAQALGIKWATPAAAGSTQSPWASNIDAASFNLDNVGAIGIGTSSFASNAPLEIASNNGAGTNASIAIFDWSRTVGPLIAIDSNFKIGKSGTAGPTANNTTYISADDTLSIFLDSVSGAPSIRLDGSTGGNNTGNVAIRLATPPLYTLDVGGDVNIPATAFFRIGGVAIPTSAPPVTKVFNRTGAVVATTGDYTAAQVTNAVSTASTYADPAWITALNWSKITGAPALFTDPTTTKGDIMARGSSSPATRLPVGTNNFVLMADSSQTLGIKWAAESVQSVFGRTGAVVATTGDYTAAKVTNAVDTTQTYANPAWITSLAWSKITGTPTLFADPTTTKGDLMARGTAAPATRLAIGTDGQVLTADSTQSLGMKWATPATGGAQSPWTGDINAANHVLNSVAAIGIGSTAFSSVPLFISCQSAQGQTSGDAVSINNSGTANGYTGMMLSGDNGSFGVEYANSAYSGDTTRQGQALLVSNAPNGMSFRIGSSTQERMRIAYNGNISIGGTLPALPDANTTNLHMVIGPMDSFQSYCGEITLTTNMNSGPAGFLNFANYFTSGAEKRLLSLSAIMDGGATNSGALIFTMANAGTMTERMRLNSTGQLGIGKTPTLQLHLSLDSAGKPSTSAWTVNSDSRLKRNIRDLAGGLDIIKRVRPVEAEYNGLDGTPEGSRVVSFLAEEIRKILPGTVTSHRARLGKDAEETDVLDFNIHEVLMHLILAVQQLAAKVESPA